MPDITVAEKKQGVLIDVAIPGDHQINEKQLEKITKYEVLEIEMPCLWGKETTTIPIVIGVCAISKGLK